MALTKIAWTQENYNSYKGCLRGCPYCYVDDMMKRYPQNYPFGKLPTAFLSRLNNPQCKTIPTDYFIGTEGDLFGPWDYAIPQTKKEAIAALSYNVYKAFDKRYDEDEETTFVHRSTLHDLILSQITKNQRHVFKMLTKYPENISKSILYPDNLIIGTTITKIEDLPRLAELRHVGARTKFISIEPILQDVSKGLNLKGIDWVIIGCQSGIKEPNSKLKWFEDIVTLCKDNSVPVFVKQAFIDGKFTKMPYISGQQWAEQPKTRELILNGKF